MKNLIGKKVKFNGEAGVVYDVTENGKVWVETNEDMYVTTVDNIEIIKGNTRATIEFDTYTSENNGRTLTAYVTVKGDNSETMFDKLANIMSNELGEPFMGCPVEGDKTYTDGITFTYEHGFMIELRNDIKRVFKMAKKELGIR